MPAIREYTNPITEIRPNDKAASAAASLAQDQGRAGYYRAQTIRQTGSDLAGAISDIGRATGNMYDQYQTKREISQGARLWTGFDDEQSKSWNEMSAATDPNDNSIVEKQRQAVIERGQKIVDGFETVEGKRWAQSQYDTRIKHWNERTAADGAQRTGRALVDNFTKMTNNAVSVVSNDPTSIDLQLETLGSAVRDMVRLSPNLTPELSGKMQTDLLRKSQDEVVKAGLYNMIAKNPERGLEVLKSGKYKDHLDASDIQALQNVARVSEKRIELQGKAQEQALTRAQKAAVENTQNDIMTKNVVVGEDGQINVTSEYFWKVQQLAGMPGGGADKARSMMSWGQTVQDRAAKGVRVADDPETFTDLSGRAFLNPSDPRALTPEEIRNASWQGRISDKSTQQLLSAVKENRSDPEMRRSMSQFNKWVTSMKPSIVKSAVINDEGLGAQQYQQFMQDKQAEFAAGLKAGLKADDMLNQRSANYLGRDFKDYLQSREKLMESLRGKLRGQGGGVPSLPPRNEGFTDRFQGDASTQTTAPKVKWQPGMSLDDLDKQLGGK